MSNFEGVWKGFLLYTFLLNSLVNRGDNNFCTLIVLQVLEEFH